MPPFRERPATLIFLLASGAITVTAFLLPEPALTVMAALVAGQTFVAAAYAAAGARRLVWGGFALIAAAIVETALLTITDRVAWSSYFAAVTVFQALACVGALAAVAVWLLFARRTAGGRTPLRYSVLELLLWMAVVALYCAAARGAEFRGILTVLYEGTLRSHRWWELLVPVGCGLLCAAALLTRRTLRISGLAAIALVPLLWALTAAACYGADQLGMSLGAYRETIWYCAVFSLCVLFDRGRMAT